MRIVELRLHPEGAGVNLHPRITILRGLDPFAGVGIIGIVHDLALGELPDHDGIVEIDGVEHPIAEAVRLAGATAECALIIPAVSLPVSRADQADITALELDVVEAESRVCELTDVIDDLAGQLGSRESLRAEMKAGLAAATARIDGSAAALDQADAALVRLARTRERPDPWTGMSDVAERMTHLRGLLAELDAQEENLPLGDRAALTAAVAVAQAARSADPVTAPEAAELAEVWLVLHERLARFESRLEAEDRSPDAAATRLEQARAAAAAAEAATVPREITPEEIQHLEDLHEATLKAESRASRGIRKGAGRAGYEAAMAALQEALEPLGYPSWAAFRMGGDRVTVGREVLDAFEQAERELEHAEQEWAQVAARLEEDSEIQSVLGEIDATLTRVTELIGSNPLGRNEDPRAVADELRSVMTGSSGVGVTNEEAVTRLREALTASGAAGHQELRSDAALVVLGGSWVEVLSAADSARARIERDRERTRAELSALEALGGGSRVDRLDEERAAVRAAEENVAALRSAMCDVVRSRVQLHVLAVTELSLAQQHDDTVTELETAEVVLEDSRRRCDETSEAASVSELCDRVPRGTGGAIPVVVVMGEAPAGCLDAVTRLPDDVQILVIGEGSGIDDWVASVGPDVAVVVEASTFV